jgi:hypothetical protein
MIAQNCAVTVSLAGRWTTRSVVGVVSQSDADARNARRRARFNWPNAGRIVGRGVLGLRDEVAEGAVVRTNGPDRTQLRFPIRLRARVDMRLFMPMEMPVTMRMRKRAMLVSKDALPGWEVAATGQAVQPASQQAPRQVGHACRNG